MRAEDIVANGHVGGNQGLPIDGNSQRGGMRGGSPVRRTKGGVAVKPAKMSGYRSESCDTDEAVLQTVSPKLVMSKKNTKETCG